MQRLYWTKSGPQANIVEEYVSLNASGKFDLAVFGMILLTFTTDHQFQSVFGNNPTNQKLSHNKISVCLGTQLDRSPADILVVPRGEARQGERRVVVACLWKQTWCRTQTARFRVDVFVLDRLNAGCKLTVSFSREGRLRCEVVSMFPTNKVLTQVCSFSSTRYGYFYARLCIGQGFGLQANVVEEYVSLKRPFATLPLHSRELGAYRWSTPSSQKTQHGHFSRGFAPFHDCVHLFPGG